MVVLPTKASIVLDMSKPRVALENYQQLYDHYGSRRPNRLANRILHAALGAIIRPQVSFAAEAEEDVANLLASNVTLVLASNHVSNFDPPVIAAMAQRERVIRPMRGKTSVLSKNSLFKQPLRPIIDQLYAIPTFRAGEATRADGSVDEARTALQRAASQRVQDMSVDLLDNGIHMAIFPEGTRNKQDPTMVQRVKHGLGDIVCRVAPETMLAIVPMGIYYGPGEHSTNLRPSVYIDNPLRGPFSDPGEVTSFAQEALQRSVDMAIACPDAS